MDVRFSAQRLQAVTECVPFDLYCDIFIPSAQDYDSEANCFYLKLQK